MNANEIETTNEIETIDLSDEALLKASELFAKAFAVGIED